MFFEKIFDFPSRMLEAFLATFETEGAFFFAFQAISKKLCNSTFKVLTDGHLKQVAKELFEAHFKQLHQGILWKFPRHFQGAL